MTAGLWAAFDYAAEDPNSQASENSLQGAATMADYAGSQSSLTDSANPAAIAAGATGEATSVSRDRDLIDARNLGPFLRGMAHGVGDGAVGFVDGIKTAVRGVSKYGYFVWVHWTEGADAAAGTSAGQAIDSATVLTLKYGPEVARIIQEIHTGQLSPETLELIVQVQPLVDDILAAIAEEFDSLSAEEQAELIGRITAATIVEVVAFVGTGGTGAALVIAAKTGKLANITSKLGGFSAKLKNKVSAAIGKFVNKVDEGTPRAGGPRYRSIYDDGTLVVDGQQPSRLPRTSDPAAIGPHSRVRYDEVNGRAYQLREFDANGNLVRDIDMTNPTFPNGTPRPGHPGPPHQHIYEMNDPRIGPRSGFRRGGPKPLGGGS